MKPHPLQAHGIGQHLERLLMSSLVLLAAWLVRLIHLERLGISHRDDNVYVLAARMLLSGDWFGFFDRLPVHAPPLYPLSLWSGFVWLGDYDYVAVTVTAFWGSASVALIFYALDRWTGRGAAWTGAFLLALSPLHLAYSRMALTDATFTFFYVGGFVIAAGRLLGSRTPGRLWASGVALGCVSALGMYAKYQGIMILISGVFFELFALAVGFAASAGWLWLPQCFRRWPRLSPQWTHTVGSLVLAGVICGLAWLPYRLYLDQRFGPELMHQQHMLFATPWREIITQAPEKILIFSVVAWLWVKGTGLLAVAGVTRGLLRPPRWLWLAVGWGVAYGAALMTYTPFVRLALPIVPLLAITAAWAGDGLVGLVQRDKGARRMMAVGVLVLVGIFMIFEARTALDWRSDGYRKLAVKITRGKMDGIRLDRLPLVMGVDYTLLFYLPHSRPGDLWDPAVDEADFTHHFYLLVDYVAWTKPVAQDRLRRWQEHMKLVSRIPNPRLAPTVFNPPYRSSLTYMVGHQAVPEHIADFLLYEVTLLPGEPTVEQ